MKRAAAFILIPLALAAAYLHPALAAETAVNAPVPARHANEAAGLKTAIFAGGCFWGVEAVFSHVKGVTSAVSGYHGGAGTAATYDQVSQGDTRHAEAVRVIYDPAVVRYDDLLRVFFSVIADPTQLDRQGPDVGSQYRTALVPMNEEQRQVAAAYLAQMAGSGVWRRPIVARIEPFHRFFPAEPYHQDFAMRNPGHPYITFWDAPKVAALRRLFPAIYKGDFTPP
ncbi:MAG: peptide-methionine (S)-S-oxide reductase MsrA [Sphingomonadales bacterium]|nr:peptide-methionine (S)-S-oxide reductase MsrA [Sphingomonadales bacterium]